MRIERLVVGLLLVSVVSAAALTVARPASAAPLYSATLLNQLGTMSTLYGSSPDRTSIAGGKLDASARMQAAIYSGGNVQTLGPSPGFTRSEGRDINASGQSVGILTNVAAGYDFTDRAFLHSGGAFTQLPTLSGTGYTHAYGINDAGTIVGMSAFKPFTYTPGSNALTQLPNPAGADGNGAAMSINEAGDIVGRVGVAGERRPAIWSGGSGNLLSLPTGATAGEALQITDDDIILGLSSYTGSTRATRFSETGPAIDLGTLGGFYSEPTDANASGQIVGWSYLAGPGFPQSAFLYENGQMYNLNTLLAPGSGWVLHRAHSINDAGEILGIGTFNGTRSGFLLSPVPEPAAFSLAGAMIFCTVLRRPHRRRVQQ